MTYYTYKDCESIVPAWYVEQWCEENGLTEDKLQEGNPLDWAQWCMISDYILHLEHQLAWH